MSKPIILTVDDDPEVLRAIARDVRHGFGEQFRVVRADSGGRALDVLRQVKLAGDAAALLLVDQRMPEMSGVEFLGEAKHLYPDAKRVLLTAYADTDAAIIAINDVQLDYYLVKPWDPPEQRLYPVLDDLLDDWMAGYRPNFDGIRVVGHRWSPESHAARDFLARNQVPYLWLDLATDAQAQELLTLVQADPKNCPILLFPDGSVLEKPSTQEIAEKAGLRGHAEVPLYDLVIIWRGTSRARRRRVWRIRGSQNGDCRAGGNGRAGRDELTNRELPRISNGPLGKRPGSPGDDAGAAIWHRVPVDA